MLAQLFVILFGLIIGSFLNCVIFRLESGESLWGRSHCQKCSRQLSWLELVPVFSFLFLSGKCWNCKQKISWQYPLVEISTAALFLLILASRFQILDTVLLWYIAASLIVIFVYDLKHFLIPDKILFPAVIAALFLHLHLGDFSYVLAAAFGFAFFGAIFWFSRGTWIGFGDCKLAILMGLLLGFPHMLVALFLAFVAGAIIGVGTMLLTKKGLKSEMPFAPFLIFGTGIAFFWGNEIVRWYFNLFMLS